MKFENLEQYVNEQFAKTDGPHILKLSTQGHEYLGHSFGRGYVGKMPTKYTTKILSFEKPTVSTRIANNLLESPNGLILTYKSFYRLDPIKRIMSGGFGKRDFRTSFGFNNEKIALPADEISEVDELKLIEKILNREDSNYDLSDPHFKESLLRRERTLNTLQFENRIKEYSRKVPPEIEILVDGELEEHMKSRGLEANDNSFANLYLQDNWIIRGDPMYDVVLNFRKRVKRDQVFTKRNIKAFT